jgi:hypothetical protein
METQELKAQIENIKQRLIGARCTPAERVYQDVLSHLESQLNELEETKDNIDDSNVDTSYFQAIAWIKGKVIETKNEDKTFTKKLIYKGKEYDVKYNVISSGAKSLYTFSKYVANQGEMILMVYPRWTHLPGRDQDYSFHFEIIGWNKVPEERELDKFYVKGIWQFIAVYPRPVITVYRNVKRAENDKLKADHCPVFWRNSPVKPFRFNPKAEKDQQGDRYFVDCVCKFNPKFNSLELLELLSPPTKQIPRYLKPIKVVATKGKTQPKNKVPTKKVKVKVKA